MHRLNLKRCPWKLRRLRLYGCIDAQIGESTPDDTAREPQVLRTDPIGQHFANTRDMLLLVVRGGETQGADSLLLAPLL